MTATEKVIAGSAAVIGGAIIATYTADKLATMKPLLRPEAAAVKASALTIAMVAAPLIGGLLGLAVIYDALIKPLRRK